MANSGNTNGSEDTLLNEVHKKVSVLQELYIEFFATLIPGFVMTLSILVLLFLFHFFAYDKLLFTEVLSKNLNPWLGFVSILVFSYTCGAIIYRKDLKKLDRISSFIQWKKQDEKSQKALAVHYPPDFDINTLKYDTEKSKLFNITATEYPYGYLRRYLVARGLYHLLIFVPWCYSREEDGFRSKTIINELKTIIKSGNNGHYTTDLLRNEAHIRMMTSMWYVMKYLWWLTIILFSTGVVLRGILFIAEHKKTEFAHIPCAIVVFGLLFALFKWGKKSIEESIHYIRIREIVTVLEQAYHIKSQTYNAHFWDIVHLRNDEFCTNNNCNKCGKNCVQKSKQIWETNDLDKITQKFHIRCDCLSAGYTITNEFSQDVKS